MDFKRKSLVVLTVMALMAVGVSAWNFAGMENLSNFIKDIVQLVPDLITLAVYGAVLALVGALVVALNKFFKSKLF